MWALPSGFATIWTTVVIDLVGLGIVVPILPPQAERFGAGPAAVGLPRARRPNSEARW